MKSLRAQLMLGFAFVAIVPLAVAMTLLAARIQTQVETDASDRLNATLGLLRADLAGDREQLVEPLELLARDRAFVRLAAVAAPGDSVLRREVMLRRVLVGFDLLEVLAPGGEVLAMSRNGDGAERLVPADPAAAAPSGPLTAAQPLPPRRPFAVHEPHFAAADGDTALQRVALRALPGGAGLLRGGRVVDRAALVRVRGSSGVDLAVRDAAGRVVVSTLPAGDEAFIAVMEDPQGAGLSRRDFLVRAVPLGGGGGIELVGLASTAAADRTIALLRTTAVLLGVLALIFAAALGVYWSRRVSRPVETLAGFSARVAEGRWDEPLEVETFTELETLAAALNRMRRDLLDYRTRLLASERHAAWSRMARMVAHEVKNPLTPISVAIADLKRSHDQGRADFPEILAEAARVISEEVESLKGLLQEFSEFGRMPAPRFEEVRVAEIAGDVRSLHHADVAAKRLWIAGHDGDARIRADRGQIRQALLNLVRNGLDATAGGGRVQIEFKMVPGALLIAVADTGPGLDAEAKARLFEPEFTTKRGGSGLGLTIVERIVQDHGGTIGVASEPGHGARFEIRLPVARGEE